MALLVEHFLFLGIQPGMTEADFAQAGLVPHDDPLLAEVVCVAHRPPFDDVFDPDRNIVDGRDDGLADALYPSLFFGPQIVGSHDRILRPQHVF